MKKSAKTALLISACVAVPTIATICPIFYYVIKNHNLHKFRFNDLTNFQATKEEYILPTQTNTAHYFYEQCNS
ncbi:hypothetical protein FACS1894218_7050 [Bacilli bacterium]|nr:hypothetical protein FACS1894218_7050 [Bacilli bacterium]